MILKYLITMKFNLPRNIYHHDIYKHQNSWVIEKENIIQCETYLSEGFDDFVE
jgi:hypothetical protein